MRKTFGIILAAVLLVAASVAAEIDWRFPTDKITPQQWTMFRAEVLAKPDIKRAEFANQLVITVDAERGHRAEHERAGERQRPYGILLSLHEIRSDPRANVRRREADEARSEAVHPLLQRA